ncbi:hypothetical protein HWV62_35654 [Athelia sp. TMB]|nr:hypothetical protein HWV62_35654 [Athelia sp. TMB]
MLKQGTGSGVNKDYGIDGLEDDLYSLFWGEGDWYYMITRETIQKDQQSYWNNTFTHCNFSIVDNSTHPTMNASTSTAAIPTGSALPMDNNTTSTQPRLLSAGAIAGIAIGSFAPVALMVGFAIWYFCVRRKDWRYTDVQLQPFLPGPVVHERPTTYHPDPLTPGLVSAPATPGFAIPYTDAPTRSSTGLTTQTYLDSRAASHIPALPYPGPASPRPESPQSGAASPPAGRSSSERHEDAGVSLAGALARSESGRLPPAYGTQKFAAPR